MALRRASPYHKSRSLTWLGIIHLAVTRRRIARQQSLFRAALSNSDQSLRVAPQYGGELCVSSLPLYATARCMIPLGMTDFRGTAKLFGIRTADLARHLYVCGASGCGKSTLLLSMMAAHARQGEGFGLIDPHGELAGQVLDRIPRQRINHTIAFDPSDDWP